MFDKNTSIFGITGHPLGHTYSPLIHNTLLQKHNYNGVYLVFDLEHPDSHILSAMRMLGVKGLSVTIPHKEWAYEIADTHDIISSAMKSSNTLVLEKDKWNAYNTDGPGALEAILEYTGNLLTHKSSGDILVLGSGGSARGIAWSLASAMTKEKKIIISARNPKTATKLVNNINDFKKNISEYIPLDEILKEKNRISLVIQTTPMGMKGNDNGALLPASFFRPDQFLFDIVYNPVQTTQVKIAMSRKTRIIPGYEMLLYQAFRQFELFTGIKPSKSKIQHVRKKLIQSIK